MYFEVDNKIRDYIVKENIAKDEFNYFNHIIQDKILRDIHDKDYVANPLKLDGDDLTKDQKHEFYMNRVFHRNHKYQNKVNRMKDKLYYYF